MDYSPPGSSVHGDSPSKNTGVGCHALLQGIFSTQGLNPGPPHCKQILYSLSHGEVQPTQNPPLITTAKWQTTVEVYVQLHTFWIISLMVNCYQPHFTVFITQHGCIMWLKVSSHFPLRLPLPPRTSTPGGMKLLERKVRSSMQPGSLQFYKYVGDNSRCSVLATQPPGFSR